MTVVTHSTNFSLPLALAVRKRGRRCVVGKVTALDSEPVLAIAWRTQPGTERCVSVPMRALDLAEAAGARWFYVRCDREPRWMRRVSIAELRRVGWYQPADGEMYYPLNQMQPVPWRPWPYAEKVVELDTVDTSRPSEGRQLRLWADGKEGAS